MAADEFPALSRAAQIGRLRSVALAAVDHYPIELRRMRLLLHGHNTTFRVDTVDGATYALRVNVGSTSTAGQLDGETAWLTAIAADTHLPVPVPLATRDGRRRTSVRFDALDRDVSVVVMSWLPGKVLDEPTPDALRALGMATAILHAHAESWRVPSGVDWPSARTVLVGDEPRIFDDHPLLTPAVREVVAAAHTDAQANLDALWGTQRARPIHADLHPGNVKWYRRRLAVFDFDDVLMGIPALDLAITAYYLRARDDRAAFHAVVEGYESVRPLPSFTDRQFESQLAARNLLLLNEILGAVNADIRRFAPQYVDNAALKLRAYLDTGEYRHQVAGVRRIDW